MRKADCGGYGWVLIMCFILLGMTLTAYSADEETPWSIRVGEHDQYTRVVFDMDQSVSYKIVPQGVEGKNLRVIFQKVSKKGGVGGPVALASGYENTYPLPNRPE